MCTETHDSPTPVIEVSERDVRLFRAFLASASVGLANTLASFERTGGVPQLSYNGAGRGRTLGRRCLGEQALARVA